MKNIKNEKICANCFRIITENENVADRVNPVEISISNVCCMDWFQQMEEDYHDNN